VFSEENLHDFRFICLSHVAGRQYVDQVDSPSAASADTRCVRVLNPVDHRTTDLFDVFHIVTVHDYCPVGGCAAPTRCDLRKMRIGHLLERRRIEARYTQARR